MYPNQYFFFDILCRKHKRTTGRLAQLDALIFRLNTVAEGIAYQMHQRIADNLQDIAVYLIVCTFQYQVYLLAFGAGHIAYDTMKFIEQYADLYQANVHDGILQVGGNALQAGIFIALGYFLGNTQVDNAVFLDEQLSHQVHQVVELFDGNIDTV